MKKGFGLTGVLITIGLLAVIVGGGYYYKSNTASDGPSKENLPETETSTTTDKTVNDETATTTEVSKAKLEICPDEWIQDEQPCSFVNSPSECSDREYYVLRGEKRELAEFNLDWVKNNCEIKAQIVH